MYLCASGVYSLKPAHSLKIRSHRKLLIAGSESIRARRQLIPGQIFHLIPWRKPLCLSLANLRLLPKCQNNSPSPLSHSAHSRRLTSSPSSRSFDFGLPSLRSALSSSRYPSFRVRYTSTMSARRDSIVRGCGEDRECMKKVGLWTADQCPGDRRWSSRLRDVRSRRALDWSWSFAERR